MNKPHFRNYLVASTWVIIFTLLILWINCYILLIINLFFIDLYLTRLVNWRYITTIKLPSWISPIWEWMKVIAIALLITIFIRTLLVEAYKIPSPSMENTLLAGDYLFVSKLSYGPRLPFTPLALPFLPSMLPDGSITYHKSPETKYKRLKGLKKVQRNDVIVFNFPEGDTVAVEYQSQSYYSLIRQYGRPYVESSFRLITHPVDKRDHYIKRCIGLPNDTLLISKGDVFINGKPLKNSGSQKMKYYLRTRSSMLNDSILNVLHISHDEFTYNPSNNMHLIFLDNRSYNILKEYYQTQSIQRYTEPAISFRNIEVFPHSNNYKWSPDDFGPLLIPGKGLTIELNNDVLPLYYRIISVYEGNKIEINGEDIFINGNLALSYTFELNYYFVLGDNRHNSADSRFWGFIPEDHLVGKAVFVWYSKVPEKNIFQGTRFERLFKPIK